MRIVPVNKQVSRIFAFNGKKKKVCFTDSSTPKCILILYFRSQELHFYSWNLLS